ncbi:MAG: hypothetical protein KIT27_05875 [Legionellales bacterium]|nr:hypothetical protein [Legionellales bacterium]
MSKTIAIENFGGTIMEMAKHRRFRPHHFHTLSHHEREAITLKAVLVHANGNLAKAAQALGISALALTRRLRDNNIFINDLSPTK